MKQKMCSLGVCLSLSIFAGCSPDLVNPSLDIVKDISQVNATVDGQDSSTKESSSTELVKSDSKKSDAKESKDLITSEDFKSRPSAEGITLDDFNGTMTESLPESLPANEEVSIHALDKSDALNGLDVIDGANGGTCFKTTLTVDWGQLQTNSTNTTPTRWAGYMMTEAGHFELVQENGFEADDLSDSRFKQRALGWTGKTTQGSDGLVADLYFDDGPFTDEVHLSFGHGRAHTFTKAEVAQGIDYEEMIDNLGNTVRVTSPAQLELACSTIPPVAPLQTDSLNDTFEAPPSTCAPLYSVSASFVEPSPDQMASVDDPVESKSIWPGFLMVENATLFKSLSSFEQGDIFRFRFGERLMGWTSTTHHDFDATDSFVAYVIADSETANVSLSYSLGYGVANQLNLNNLTEPYEFEKVICESGRKVRINVAKLPQSPGCQNNS